MKKKKARIGQAQRMRNLVKEIVGIVIIGVILLITSSVSNIVMTMTLQGQNDTTKAIEEYRVASKNLTVDVQSYVITGKVHYQDTYKKALETDKVLDKAVASLNECKLTDKEKAMFSTIQETDEKMLVYETAAFEAMSSNNQKKAQEAVFGDEYLTMVEENDELLAQLVETTQARMKKSESIVSVVQAVSQIAFIGIVVGLIVIMFVTITFVRDELIRPVVKVSKELENIAAGDFSGGTGIEPDDTEVGRMIQAMRDMKGTNHDIIAEVTAILEEMGNGNYLFELNQDYVGEFGAIKEAFVVIREKMTETFQTLKEVSDQIDAGSEQLSGAAQDLAEGCTSQAAQISDIVESIKQVAIAMNENAKEAENTVALSTAAGEKLTQGNEKMDELKAAIAEISRCSEEIGTIISTIEDIATQTNLLSLNAAIEAARAGEAGKGFAVVAEQVKKLAEESATAAGQTTQLIETTIGAVEKGIVIAEQTAEDMQEVMEGAKNATVKMSAIAEVLVKEAAEVQEVNERVSTISEVVSNNSAASEETAAVSEEQTAQVQTMVELMSQFKI